MGECTHRMFNEKELDNSSIIKNKSNIIKISVIIPIYNVEKYIKQCLESVINQTLADIEIICIDDGSTDNSLQILEEYARVDKRFKVISQKNEGQGIARNKGIEIAKGEYIIFLDSDDWLEINALEFLYKEAKTKNMQVVQFDYINHDEYSKKSKYITFANEIENKYKARLNDGDTFNWKNYKEGCLYNLDLHIWNRIYNLDFIKKNKISFAPTKNGEDHLFRNGILLCADKILYLNQYLYHYRTRKGSIVNTKDEINMCIIENIDYLKDFLIEHNFYNELNEEFEKYKLQVLIWHYFQLPESTINKYKDRVKNILNNKQYKKFLKKIKSNRSILENIFSIKNSKDKTHKIITICGLNIKIRRKI